MTNTPTIYAEHTGDPVRVWIWFGIPEVGALESLLMVVTNDVNGLAYRPLIALSSDDADALEVHAVNAAAALGVTAVVREFECTAIRPADLIPTEVPS